MQQQQFSIDIAASREKVWSTLWDDTTLRDWANLIDEGMYMKGELKEGVEVEFLTAHGGYGVTSFVEKLIPNELVAFTHMMDTQALGTKEREKEWTGSRESYALTEHDGVTRLTLTTDIPPEQEETMNDRLPKALQRVKELSEDTTEHS